MSYDQFNDEIYNAERKLAAQWKLGKIPVAKTDNYADTHAVELLLDDAHDEFMHAYKTGKLSDEWVERYNAIGDTSHLVSPNATVSTGPIEKSQPTSTTRKVTPRTRANSDKNRQSYGKDVSTFRKLALEWKFGSNAPMPSSTVPSEEESDKISAAHDSAVDEFISAFNSNTLPPEFRSRIPATVSADISGIKQRPKNTGTTAAGIPKLNIERTRFGEIEAEQLANLHKALSPNSMILQQKRLAEIQTKGKISGFSPQMTKEIDRLTKNIKAEESKIQKRIDDALKNTLNKDDKVINLLKELVVNTRERKRDNRVEKLTQQQLSDIAGNTQPEMDDDRRSWLDDIGGGLRTAEGQALFAAGAGVYSIGKKTIGLVKSGVGALAEKYKHKLFEDRQRKTDTEDNQEASPNVQENAPKASPNVQENAQENTNNTEPVADKSTIFSKLLSIFWSKDNADSTDTENSQENDKEILEQISKNTSDTVKGIHELSKIIQGLTKQPKEKEKYKYNEKTKRWQDVETGRFVKQSVVDADKLRRQSANSPASLLAKNKSGEIAAALSAVGENGEPTATPDSNLGGGSIVDSFLSKGRLGGVLRGVGNLARGAGTIGLAAAPLAAMAAVTHWADTATITDENGEYTTTGKFLDSASKMVGGNGMKADADKSQVEKINEEASGWFQSKEPFKKKWLEKIENGAEFTKEEADALKQKYDIDVPPDQIKADISGAKTTITADKISAADKSQTRTENVESAIEAKSTADEVAEQAKQNMLFEAMKTSGGNGSSSNVIAAQQPQERRFSPRNHEPSWRKSQSSTLGYSD